MKYIPMIFAALLLLGACRATKRNQAEDVDLKRLEPLTPKTIDKVFVSGEKKALHIFLSEYLEFTQKETRTIDTLYREEGGLLVKDVVETRTGGLIYADKHRMGEIKNIIPLTAANTTTPVVAYELQVSFDPNHPELTISFIGRLSEKQFKLKTPFKYGGSEYTLTKGAGNIALCDPRLNFLEDSTFKKRYEMPGYDGGGGSGGDGY